MPTIRDLRIAKGWSQQVLATRAGIGIQTLSRLEQGKTKPFPNTVAALATALGVNPNEISVNVVNRVGRKRS